MVTTAPTRGNLTEAALCQHLLYISFLVSSIPSMLPGVLEKLGYSEQQKKYPADYLNRGQHARDIARGHDVAIADGAYRYDRKVYCLGKAKSTGRVAHAEMVSRGKLRHDAEC